MIGWTASVFHFGVNRINQVSLCAPHADTFGLGGCRGIGESKYTDQTNGPDTVEASAKSDNLPKFPMEAERGQADLVQTLHTLPRAMGTNQNITAAGNRTLVPRPDN